MAIWYDEHSVLTRATTDVKNDFSSTRLRVRYVLSVHEMTSCGTLSGAAMLKIILAVCALSLASVGLAAPKAAAKTVSFRTVPIIQGSCSVPVMSKNSLRNEESGIARVAMNVGADGTVTRPIIAISSGFRELDSAAMAAAPSCKFKVPKTRKAIPGFATVDFVFSYDEDPVQTKKDSDAFREKVANLAQKGGDTHVWSLLLASGERAPVAAGPMQQAAGSDAARGQPAGPDFSAGGSPRPAPDAVRASARIESAPVSGANASAKPLQIKGFDEARADACISFSFDAGKLKAKNNCAHPIAMIGAVCEEQVAARSMPKHDGTSIQPGELFMSVFGGQTATQWHFLKPGAEVDPFGSPFYQTMPNGWQSRPAVVKQVYFAAFKPPYVGDEGQRWNLSPQLNPIRFQWDRTLRRLHDELGWGYSFQRWGNPGKLESCASADLNDIWRRSESE